MPPIRCMAQDRECLLVTEQDPVFGCVLWTGAKDKKGYGRAGRRLAHIAAYEREYGPVPEGFELDHVCRRRNCVALHHLEPVTHNNNLLRRKWSHRTRLAKCPRGHDYKTNGVVTPEGGIVCRTCNKEAM